MNRGHRQLCASARWGRYIRDELVPWVVGERPLGGSLLEIGPGPGLTTDVLRSRTRRLTAVEADAKAAASLQQRLAGANVTVVKEAVTYSGLDVGPVRIPGLPRLDEKDREDLFALLRGWRETGDAFGL